MSLTLLMDGCVPFAFFAKPFAFSPGRTVGVCLWTSVCVQVRSILNFALVITPIVPSGASAFKACVGNGCGNMDPHGHQSADVCWSMAWVSILWLRFRIA